MAKTTFSPSTWALQHGGSYGTSGINWSYMDFPTKEQAEAFDVACADNNYRTRNLTQSQTGGWSIQYHHYES